MLHKFRDAVHADVVWGRLCACLLVGVLATAMPSLGQGGEDDWTPIRAGSEASDFSRDAAETLVNPSFEKGLHGWEVVSLNGAEGAWRIERIDGAEAIAIRRTNGRGTILLRSTVPVEFDPEASYSFRSFYQSSDAPQTASLLMRVEKRPGHRDYDASIEKGVGLYDQRSIVNTPSGTWTKLLHQVRGTGSNGKAFLNFILDGNPCTVRIDRVEFEDLEQAREEWSEKNRYTPRPKPDLISREAMLSRLEELPELSARLERVGGVATLFVNNEPVMPVLYKQNPGQPMYHLGGPFLENNVKLQLVDARFSHHSQPDRNMWLGHEQYDIEAGHNAIELALRGAPEAQLVLDVQLGTYKEWGERYPDELYMDKEGRRLVRVGGGGHWLGFAEDLDEYAHITDDGQWQYSYFSPVWRREMKEALRAYLASLQDTPYAKRVVGVMISGGRDGQFAMRWPDHSPHAQQAFRNWLERTYETPAALSKAWGREIRSFDEVSIPDDLESGKYLNREEEDWIYDPETEQSYIDYRIFWHEALAELHDEFARVCKEAMRKDIIAIRYFMSGFNNGFQSTMGVSRKILPSSYIDAVAPQPSYGLRRPGKAMVMRQALESYHLHNKLVIMEFDHRSWLRTGGSDELRHIAMSTSHTLEDYVAVQRKLMGSMIARGHGFWYYDMVAGWYHDPDIQASIQKDLKSYPLSTGKQDFKADVAVIVDEETVYNLPTIRNIGHPALKRSQIDQLNLLSTAGVPYDLYYFEDLVAHPDLSDYKVFVFLSTWRVTEQQREFLDGLKRDHRTLVWMYAPGYSDGRDLSLDHMHRLTGIRIRSAGKRGVEPVYIENRIHPLAEGLQELQGIGYLDRTSWKRSSEPTGIDVPQFHASDDAAVSLARFARSGHTAIAVRDFDEWRSVYVADPGGISPEFLNNLARDAGAYVLTEPSVLTEMNGSFISAHGLEAGTYTFRLPRKANVRDLNTGAVVVEDAAQFEYTIEPSQSYWFSIE